jgi:histidyl-tRNA synthetase
MPREKLRAEAEEFGMEGRHFDELAKILASGSEVLPRLPEEVRERSALVQMMDGVAKDLFVFDPLIVRGLQYYTSTVFEVFDLSPENNRSLFGGGRYSDLAGLFTTQRIPGIGFGTPGYFRLSYCVDDAVLEGALPGFREAFAEAAS